MPVLLPPCHVQLADRIAAFMCSFAWARRLEAVAKGVALRPDTPEATAGLVLGIGRAYQRLSDTSPHALPPALRHLAETRAEFSAVPRLLQMRAGSAHVAAWADIGEAAVESAELHEDPLPVLLEFAVLARLLGYEPRDTRPSGAPSSRSSPDPRHRRHRRHH